MILDVYAGLVADDLDAVAEGLDAAVIGRRADSVADFVRASNPPGPGEPCPGTGKEAVTCGDARAAYWSRTDDLRITRSIPLLCADLLTHRRRPSHPLMPTTGLCRVGVWIWWRGLGSRVVDAA